MRFLSISLWALMMLTQSVHAQSQNASPEKPMTDQMERGVTLSAPLQSSSPEDFTKDLQAELKRVGCFDSIVDGVWGDKTKTALLNFARFSKLDVPTDVATPVAVDAVKSRTDRVCPLDCGPGRVESNGQCIAKAQPAPTPQPQPQAKPARPQPTGEARRPAARERSDDKPSSGMCWRQDGRGTSLVPCSEAPTGRRAY
jgi:hypothetical protein